MGSDMMRVPTRREAEIFIEEAREFNPGPWINHSYVTAEAAYHISLHHSGLDPDISYVLGLLHDIGRRDGIMQMRHSISGYEFLKLKGFDDAARICLTHSFAFKDINAICGKWDCSEQDFTFVSDYLSAIEFDDYDRLIQMCDVLALPAGFCIIEKRLVDIALRYGTTPYTVKKWKAIFEVKEKFEEHMQCSIYSLLPGIVENTFGF